MNVDAVKPAEERRHLLAVPTSAPHASIVAAMVERFRAHCDIWLFVWDGSQFDSGTFEECRVFHHDGYKKWDFARELLMPQAVSAYDYLFVWDDDLDVSRFDPARFLKLISHNRLEMAQPALTGDSYVSHRITVEQPGVGRLTDFVEVMAPVWTREAWRKWYAMLTPSNPWGWGYDLAARSACGYERMGIVDCTPVRHLKPLTRLPEQFAGMRHFFNNHPEYQPCQGRVFGPLMDIGFASSENAVERT